MTTTINITKAGPERHVSPKWISLAAGDQVTITAAHDAAGILCFSSESEAILSAPSAHVDIAGGASTTFTVGEVTAKQYIIMVQAHGWPPPSVVPAGPASAGAMLVFKDASGKDFPGPPEFPDGA